jgi:hypothetical protein
MKNLDFKKDLENITKDDFQKLVKITLGDEVTTIAPLGYSGDTYILCENEDKPISPYDPKGHVGRSSEVSFCNWSGHAEILITDLYGSFICHCQHAARLPIEFIVDSFWLQFNAVKHLIKESLPPLDKSFKVAERVEYSAGFEILKKAFMK